MKNIKISLFGSSIMEGRIGAAAAAERYYNLLLHDLSERFPHICFSIFNGAVGGLSTRELMDRFDDNVLKYTPDYCLVMFGANNDDQEHPERNLQEGELELLMSRFEAQLPTCCRRIGVVLNPVINELHYTAGRLAWQKILRAHGGFNELLELEREKARSFYQAHNYPVVDLAKLMSEDPEKFICNDGIHLKSAGHELFSKSLFAVLEQCLIRDGHDTKEDL